MDVNGIGMAQIFGIILIAVVTTCLLGGFVILINGSALRSVGMCVAGLLMCIFGFGICFGTGLALSTPVTLAIGVFGIISSLILYAVILLDHRKYEQESSSQEAQPTEVP